VDGCENQAVKGGVCKKHGAKAPRCSVDGCENQAQKGGVCVKHRLDRPLEGTEEMYLLLLDIPGYEIIKVGKGPPSRAAEAKNGNPHIKILGYFLWHQRDDNQAWGDQAFKNHFEGKHEAHRGGEWYRADWEILAMIQRSDTWKPA